MNKFFILDAARDYMRIGVARTVSPKYANLFIGQKGNRMEHVAPHCFQSDRAGVIEHMTLSGVTPDEVGILVESDEEFEVIFKHLRRFLTVERESDRRKVIFRFYDPRILRAFLPVCTPEELRDFFGPVTKFCCQGNVPGEVLSLCRDSEGSLQTQSDDFAQFYEQRHGVRPDTINPIPLTSVTPKEHKLTRQIRENILRVYRT